MIFITILQRRTKSNAINQQKPAQASQTNEQMDIRHAHCQAAVIAQCILRAKLPIEPKMNSNSKVKVT
jgi:hypothetical protein